MEAEARAAFHNKKAIELVGTLEWQENLESYPDLLQPQRVPVTPSQPRLVNGAIRAEV
ncbi:hypothetical protein [Pseudomonas fulva]|uniref:hypothetical protein n=1 Tax=Pseudomonas fulva TaxID=47880 RepID=UPI001E5DEB53|nr:hypothetical protein [Pseudomonas fulva]